MAPQTVAADPTLLALYASSADAALWPRALDTLCSDTGACSAVVQAFRFDDGRARVLWSAQDSRSAAQHRLPSHGVVDDDNPRLHPQRALRGLDRIAGDDQLFDAGDVARPRLQQQLATLGLGRFIGTLREAGGGIYLGLALHRSIGDNNDFSAAQIGRFAALTPHIGQAFDVSRRLQIAQALDAQLRKHFDSLRCGLLVCDLQGHVRWHNRAAELLLARHAPLRLSMATLQGKRAADTALLLRELTAASADVDGTRYLHLGHGGDALHVAIQAAAAPASMMLVLTRADAVSAIAPDALATLFGLTPTEAQLAAALVAGRTVKQYALQRRVSEGTARCQLKLVQAKTGARRQSDIVRLVLCSAAAQILVRTSTPRAA
jgi:DNA-binding CsgD family transcriptional regulator/PAS domain-containing protein